MLVRLLRIAAYCPCSADFTFSHSQGCEDWMVFSARDAGIVVATMQWPPGFPLFWFQMYTAAQGYRQLTRKLKANHKVELNKDDVSMESLKKGNLVVFAGPREKFSEAELAAIKEYLAGGGSVLLMLAGGGDQRFNTNLNALLEEWGVSFNTDSVVRTVYYKYFHPKEVSLACCPWTCGVHPSMHTTCLQSPLSGTLDFPL